MRKIVYGTVALFLLLTFSGIPAFGYGGDGGGGDGDNLSSGSTDLGNGNQAPAGFTSLPIDDQYVSDLSPQQTSSTERTAVTGETRTLSPEELQQLQAAFDFILITTGGVIIGYCTAGAGWTVLGQATASGTYAGLTTYATSDDKTGEQTTKAAIQDFAVGFIPVNPVGQAAISQGITKIREQLPDKFNHEGASLSSLRSSYDPHYAW